MAIGISASGGMKGADLVVGLTSEDGTDLKVETCPPSSVKLNICALIRLATFLFRNESCYMFNPNPNPK